MTDRVEVTQADREAANAIVPFLCASTFKMEVAEQFARHRIAALRAQSAEVERLRAGVRGAVEIFSNCSISYGVCMCGDSMDQHGPEHQPCDQGQYAVECWQAEYAALEGDEA